MITIILEYYNVIVSDYQQLHATITIHQPRNHWSTLNFDQHRILVSLISSHLPSANSSPLLVFCCSISSSIFYSFFIKSLPVTSQHSDQPHTPLYVIYIAHVKSSPHCPQQCRWGAHRSIVIILPLLPSIFFWLMCSTTMCIFCFARYFFKLSLWEVIWLSLDWPMAHLVEFVQQVYMFACIQVSL
jgi:hypothetical protein